MNTNIPSSAFILHQKIDAYLSQKPTEFKTHMSDDEVYKLILEIKEQHIELEMQNAELHLAKEKVDNAAQKYSDLYDFAPFGYFTISPESNIINTNLNGAQMLGEYRKQVVNTYFDSYVAPESKSIFKFFIEKVFSCANKVNCELCLLNNDICIYLEGKKSENGNECLLAAVDVTERRRVEQQLFDSEEKYHQITDNIMDVVWTADMKFNITFVSPSVEKMMHVTPENHCLRPFIERFTPDSYKEVNRVFALELANENDPNIPKVRSRIIEVEICRIDGSTFWVEINLSFLRDENMNPIGIHGITRDIDKRKMAEFALKEKMDEMKRLHYLTIGRELTMIELKKEVNALLLSSGKGEKYLIVE